MSTLYWDIQVFSLSRWRNHLLLCKDILDMTLKSRAVISSDGWKRAKDICCNDLWCPLPVTQYATFFPFGEQCFHYKLSVSFQVKGGCHSTARSKHLNSVSHTLLKSRDLLKSPRMNHGGVFIYHLVLQPLREAISHDLWFMRMNHDCAVKVTGL